MDGASLSLITFYAPKIFRKQGPGITALAEKPAPQHPNPDMFHLYHVLPDHSKAIAWKLPLSE